MSSGSYFTIYRKCINCKLELDKLNALKKEYEKASNVLSSNLVNDIPLLMDECFSANNIDSLATNNNYYDSNGVLHQKLLEFHFCSAFSCLKEKFNLDQYAFSTSSTFINRMEAQCMLQAINYVLSEKYDKTFENILNNEYVAIFGNGYSLYDDRFSNAHERIYVDKNKDNYTITFGDESWNREIAESDDEIRFNVKRVRSCIQAFLDAESNSWENTELILEYSVY